MTQTEYNKAKAESWRKFKKESECEGGCLMADAFFAAFDHAYALGKQSSIPSNSGELKLQMSDLERLRFAAVAMQGILSNQALLTMVADDAAKTLSGDDVSYRAVAKASLAFADALISECIKCKDPI